MNVAKMISVLGGYQVVANLINAYKPKPAKAPEKPCTRQRVMNWSASNELPSYAILGYPRLWNKARRIAKGDTK